MKRQRHLLATGGTKGPAQSLGKQNSHRNILVLLLVVSGLVVLAWPYAVAHHSHHATIPASGPLDARAPQKQSLATVDNLPVDSSPSVAEAKLKPPPLPDQFRPVTMKDIEPIQHKHPTLPSKPHSQPITKPKQPTVVNESPASDQIHARSPSEARQGTQRGRLMCDGKQVDSEVIYWKSVPRDIEFESPLTPHHHEHDSRYVTFQYDQGGWNNIRMGMEIVIVAAHAMGRTLVSPPKQSLYLLGQAHEDKSTGRTVRAPKYSFADFFDLDLLASHHGFHVMKMEDFLKKEATSGKLGQLPPGNKTDLWGPQLWGYLKSVCDVTPTWSGKFLAMPSTVEELKDVSHQHFQQPDIKSRMHTFGGKRTPVFYDAKMQRAKLIHFPAGGPHRLLQHWYAFTFFADPKLQSFYKRFVRDFMRYKDEIQCAGAELVQAVRERALQYTNGNSSDYYALHVRRGDFQFKEVKISAAQIIENLKGNQIIPRGAVVYISTDDPKGVCQNCLSNRKPCPKGKAAQGVKGCIVDPSWDAFREVAGWKIVFLNDFLGKGVLQNANPNYFGMVESIVCSRAKKFAGTWWSTFTGYIHRLRGYHGLGEETYYHTTGRGLKQLGQSKLRATALPGSGAMAGQMMEGFLAALLSCWNALTGANSRQAAA